MAEFYGTDLQVAIQKRMLSRHEWLQNTPEIANGGRVLNFLEPEKTGWDTISEFIKEDRIAAIVAQPLETMMPFLRETFGSKCQFPCWNVFLGDAQNTITACKVVTKSVPIPAGWHIESFEIPTDAQISEVQKLNLATGIAPYPAFYTRSETVPCLTTCLWNAQNVMVATASANYRYHPESRFSGYVFVGSVSVAPECCGTGLGKLLNAVVLLDSHKSYDWVGALEQAKLDNAPSRRMIEACGLEMQKEFVTIGVVDSTEEFTR